MGGWAQCERSYDFETSGSMAFGDGLFLQMSRIVSEGTHLSTERCKHWFGSDYSQVNLSSKGCWRIQTPVGSSFFYLYHGLLTHWLAGWRVEDSCWSNYLSLCCWFCFHCWFGPCNSDLCLSDLLSPYTPLQCSIVSYSGWNLSMSRHVSDFFVTSVNFCGFPKYQAGAGLASFSWDHGPHAHSKMIVVLEPCWWPLTRVRSRAPGSTTAVRNLATESESVYV